MKIDKDILAASSREELSESLKQLARRQYLAPVKEVVESCVSYVDQRAQFGETLTNIDVLLDDLLATDISLESSISLANTLGCLGLYSPMWKITLNSWKQEASRTGPSKLRQQINTFLGTDAESQPETGSFIEYNLNDLDRAKLNIFRAHSSGRKTELKPEGWKESYFQYLVKGRDLLFLGPGISAPRVDEIPRNSLIVQSIGNTCRSLEPDELAGFKRVGYVNRETTKWLKKLPKNDSQRLVRKFKFFRPRFRVPGLAWRQASIDRESPRFASMPFISGVPNMAQVLTNDLLTWPIHSLTLTGIDLWASGINYREGEVRKLVDQAKSTNSAFRFNFEMNKMISLHNPIENFLFLERLMENPKLHLDSKLTGQLRAGVGSYVSDLENAYRLG